MVIPGLTFADAVVCMPGEVEDIREHKQQGVGRQDLGCHGNEAAEVVP